MTQFLRVWRNETFKSSTPTAPVPTVRGGERDGIPSPRGRCKASMAPERPSAVLRAAAALGGILALPIGRLVRGFLRWPINEPASALGVTGHLR